MPSQHRYPPITPRPAPELRERAKLAVAQVDSNLNQHIIGFLRWLVGDTNDLPPRPTTPIPALDGDAPEPTTPKRRPSAKTKRS